MAGFLAAALPWAELALPFLGGLAGGASSAKGLRAQNRMAQAEAQKNRAFQERMSSTSHQREVKDLRAAGLNPILSGTGGAGASSPGGNMAPVVDEKTQAVATAMTTARQLAEISNIRANTALTKSKTGVISPAAKIGETAGDIITTGKQSVIDKAKGIDLANMADTTKHQARIRRAKKAPKYKWPTQDHNAKRNKDFQRQTFNTFFKERLAQGTPTRADLKKLETALNSGLMNDAIYWRKYLNAFEKRLGR